MFHGKLSLQVAEGLKELRARIDAAKIPSSKLDETLNLATWNIREFGKRRRSEAAIHYIAEIVGQFDLVSVVELRDNLTDLGRILPIPPRQNSCRPDRTWPPTGFGFLL